MFNFKRGVKCGDARNHATYCPTSLYVAKNGTSNVSDMKSSSHIQVLSKTKKWTSSTFSTVWLIPVKNRLLVKIYGF